MNSEMPVFPALQWEKRGEVWIARGCIYFGIVRGISWEPLIPEPPGLQEAFEKCSTLTPQTRELSPEYAAYKAAIPFPTGTHIAPYVHATHLATQMWVSGEIPSPGADIRGFYKERLVQMHESL